MPDEYRTLWQAAPQVRLPISTRPFSQHADVGALMPERFANPAESTPSVPAAAYHFAGGESGVRTRGPKFDSILSHSLTLIFVRCYSNTSTVTVSAVYGINDPICRLNLDDA